MTEELKKELKKYHRFPKKTAKLKDILALIRSGAYSNYDEGGDELIICPECEEWTIKVLEEKANEEMDKLRIENAELIQRILQLEKELSKERAYNYALVTVIKNNNREE